MVLFFVFFYVYSLIWLCLIGHILSWLVRFLIFGFFFFIICVNLNVVTLVEIRLIFLFYDKRLVESILV